MHSPCSTASSRPALPATTSARATHARCNLTPAPQGPRTSHESCSHLAPAHCNDSIRLSDCLPACLPACLTACLCRQRNGAIRALRTSPPPSACSTPGTPPCPLGTSRPSGVWTDLPWSVGACLLQYAEAVPPAAAAATRIGEDTLPPSGLGPREHEQRRQAATVARVCDSVDLFVIYLACHVERLR